MKKLFGNRISPACEYCAVGRPAPGGERILCPRKGVVARSHACRKYRYDPLKRVPKRKQPLGQYQPEDFALGESDS